MINLNKLSSVILSGLVTLTLSTSTTYAQPTLTNPAIFAKRADLMALAGVTIPLSLTELEKGFAGITSPNVFCDSSLSSEAAVVIVRLIEQGGLIATFGLGTDSLQSTLSGAIVAAKVALNSSNFPGGISPKVTFTSSLGGPPRVVRVLLTSISTWSSVSPRFPDSQDGSMQKYLQLMDGDSKYYATASSVSGTLYSGVTQYAQEVTLLATAMAFYSNTNQIAPLLATELSIDY